jgi:hypothetical protein
VAISPFTGRRRGGKQQKAPRQRQCDVLPDKVRKAKHGIVKYFQHEPHMVSVHRQCDYAC